jgi:hypothetical protein
MHNFAVQLSEQQDRDQTFRSAVIRSEWRDATYELWPNEHGLSFFPEHNHEARDMAR